MTSRHVSALVALAIAVTACSSVTSENGSATTSTTTVVQTTTIEQTTTTTATTTPSTAASNTTATPTTTTPTEVTVEWIVQVLNNGGEVTTAEIEQRFSPSFLAEIPAEQIVALFPQLVSGLELPVAPDSIETVDGIWEKTALIASDGARLPVELAVSPGTPPKILGILFGQIEFAEKATIESIDVRLNELGQQSSLGVYEVTNGTCTVVHQLRADQPIVLGSIFKLWVLSALANEIDAGRASWNETVPVTDELRSSPDGEIFFLETGTEVSLQDLAEAMISLSDNTATDMLVNRLGRSAVEAVLDDLGIDNPTNRPILSTGNLFSIKFDPDAPNSDDYRALDESGKRELLEQLDARAVRWVAEDLSLDELAELTNSEGVPLDQPRDFDIEWFATAEQICRTYLRLNAQAQTDGLEVVADILEVNPGVDFDTDRWPTIRYKGGSEPGVLAMAWWIEGNDARRYVVVGGITDADAALDEFAATSVLSSAVELVE